MPYVTVKISGRCNITVETEYLVTNKSYGLQVSEETLIRLRGLESSGFLKVLTVAHETPVEPVGPLHYKYKPPAPCATLIPDEVEAPVEVVKPVVETSALNEDIFVDVRKPKTKK